MQSFWEFIEHVHQVANCNNEECDIDKFLNEIKDNLFNEELDFNSRRIHFREACLANLAVFNAIFKLQKLCFD